MKINIAYEKVVENWRQKGKKFLSTRCIFQFYLYFTDANFQYIDLNKLWVIWINLDCLTNSFLTRRQFFFHFIEFESTYFFVKIIIFIKDAIFWWECFLLNCVKFIKMNCRSFCHSVIIVERKTHYLLSLLFHSFEFFFVFCATTTANQSEPEWNARRSGC